MGNKRAAAEVVPSPATPPSVKRQRARAGYVRPPPSPRALTPGRPPRMPRAEREGAGDRGLVQRLQVLSAGELVEFVKDVEMRFQKLAAFEADEIRRAQALGFGRNSPLVVRRQATAWNAFDVIEEPKTLDGEYARNGLATHANSLDATPIDVNHVVINSLSKLGADDS